VKMTNCEDGMDIVRQNKMKDIKGHEY